MGGFDRFWITLPILAFKCITLAPKIQMEEMESKQTNKQAAKRRVFYRQDGPQLLSSSSKPLGLPTSPSKVKYLTKAPPSQEK